MARVFLKKVRSSLKKTRLNHLYGVRQLNSNRAMLVFVFELVIDFQKNNF